MTACGQSRLQPDLLVCVCLFSSQSSALGTLIEKLQLNADKVQKNIFDIEQNLNKVRSET